ncbi:MAG: hypothetical protein ACR2ME_09695 [Acidimicrobiia bacterium]
MSYDVAYAGETSSHKIDPLYSSADTSQAVFVVLPDVVTTLELADPPEGEFAWYSDSGDNIDHTMTSIPIVVPTDDPTLRMSLWYQIEQDWDYAYVRVSTDGGATWVNLEGNVTTNDNPTGQNFGNGITGTSDGWVAAEFGMSAYAGQTVQLQLRYWTDGAVVEPGILADEITLGTFFSGAEPGDEAQWTLDGWRVTDGSEEVASFNAYVAESRAYHGYDHGLLTGPYNFSFVAKPDWVEHFPYQNGLLIWYWNDYYTDNNTSQHPGAGLILPVDSHPKPLIAPNGAPWRARVQMYDATFGREATDALTLSFQAGGVQYGPTTYRSQPGVPVFNDLRSYWSPRAPLSSVIVPNTGTVIEVVSVSPNGTTQIQVRPA